ncbi:SusC/RagA family TonB-linked outer membrane protein [Mucilaginibacter gotjawali]|uniref:TonB-dependent Receptor Plug Domain protein n=2 Tax=Mucilaginibacter gotjawali TaxID=1550579 RepID=A0A125T2E8_9SPHI|nr:TonB-dependent receptor [Mucilaginibacter gotjawali]MBB3057297.1 TonB-linked SusC/RagA family outer membrane protein [Mucilaginibacter gotjawali]BAU52936.1 TonB-dependent Receptor Plug Domain protein [Mucilaginibacter gotjawali]
MRKLILFFLVIFSILPALLYAQNRVVSGVVRDDGGVLPGASVVEKGMPGNGVTTNIKGRFTLTLKGSSNIIVVQFIGYARQEVNVAGKVDNIDITLKSNSQDLNEVIVVGFGKTKRITTTGSVSTISAQDIRTVPTANVQNTLSGKIPGFFSQQSSGQPGKDASDFFIRGVSSLNPAGNQPLIIVDDIEYTYDQLQQINVNEIESISVLKDAATTAIYGIKGANGVLVVTTRRGKAGKPQVNFRNEAGVQAPTITPKFLNAYQSAVLINQAETNDGTLPDKLTFSPNDLVLYQNHSDPYGHPDVNWYDKIFNKYSYQANSNLDISGGTDQLKYFISGGILQQNGLVKHFTDPVANINNNYEFSRYDFRSNLDLKANKTLDIRLDVTTRFSSTNSPNESASSTLSDVYNFAQETPFTAPFLNPNGSYAYAYSNFNPSHLPTLNARLATGGYQNEKRTDYNVLFNIKQNLDAITNGLSVTGRVAYSSTEAFTRSTGNYGPIPTYHYDPATGQTILNPAGSYVFPQIYYAGNVNIYTTNVNLQAFANYDRTFNGKNHVTGLVLLNQSSQTYDANAFLDATSVGVPAKFRGISARGTYDYAGKYLFDINAAYNGTDRFAANHRYGWFPAVSVGYNITKEDYFKKITSVFSLLKIRGSYGIVGSDVAPGNTYIYSQYYNQNSNQYNFGTSPNYYNQYYEGALSNANVVWERQKELDLGLDMNLFKDHLSFTADYFHNVRYDQLIIPNNVPLVLGVGLPAINLGRTQNNGFDGQIGYHNSIRDVQYGVNFVFSYAKNKILFESEAQAAYPWLARTGHSINQPFGYHSLGYYTPGDVAAINAYKAGHSGSNAGDPIAVPDNGETIQAGDLKYQDLNHDGYINVFDQKAIGHPNLPNTTLGLNLTAGYKGFSASVLLQGAFNYSFMITGTGIEPFQSQFQPIHLTAWTPENASSAQFPRLTTNPQTINSPTYYPSDYWLLNAYYIRLKTVDIGYQFPSKSLPFHLDNARVYLSAYNLFTWDNYKRYQQDPEIQTNTAGDAYINQRVINFGIQLGF